MSENRDIGTPERHRKGDKIIPFQLMEETSAGFKPRAGEVVMLNKSECSLDDMLHRGWLGGRQEDAERRHAAVMWLRELWLGLHQSIGIASYHDAKSKFSDLSCHMTEVESWNLGCLMDTKEFMGLHWRPLDAVCIMDRRYGTSWPALCEALDILADYRGI